MDVYSDENRGRILFGKRIHQVVKFEGLRYGNITPTDIDGLIEYRGKAVLLYEFKLRGYGMSEGQRLALTRIVDGLEASGKFAALLLCEHDTPVEQDVDAAGAEVAGVYWRHEWREGGGRTVKDWTDAFLGFAELMA